MDLLQRILNHTKDEAESNQSNWKDSQWTRIWHILKHSLWLVHGDYHTQCEAEIKFVFKPSRGPKGIIQLKQERKRRSHQKKRERKFLEKNTHWERVQLESKARGTDLKMLWLLSHLFPVYFSLLCFATCSRHLVFSDINKEVCFFGQITSPTADVSTKISIQKILFVSTRKVFLKVLQKQS